jgi:hypothetical protein
MSGSFIFKAGSSLQKDIGTLSYDTSSRSGLYATDYGTRLAGSDDVWWCGPAHKIWQKRPMPPSGQRSAFVSVQLARNEYEAIQVVIHPSKEIKNVTARCSDLTGPDQSRINASFITIDQVVYVPVKIPTDSIGAADNWPDPLPPLTEPVTLEAGINQPFWVTVYAPRGLPGGLYKGSLHFSGDNWKRDIPFQVTVWDFTLSDQTHVKSAFGLSPQFIPLYQNVSGRDFQTVMDKYYTNFAAHRISPYNPIYGSGIHVDWGLDQKKATHLPVTAQQVKIDFTDFDKAMEEAFRNYRMTTFKLNLQGVGSGSSDSYTPGKIGPYIQGSKEYNILFGSYVKQLQHHLAQKGWLDKAYLYWFDEPGEKIHDTIQEMADLIYRYAPGLKWMLTDSITEKLARSVDIWCPVTYKYVHKHALEQQAKGREVWWYICTGPKAPYVGEFIDHPAIEPRLWLWQTWKNNVQGILIWNTNYWTADSAYPNSLQNPWDDPQSWRAGGPRGRKWGNGDGRFFYPPNRDPNNNKKPFITGPVNSLRWELLRDGIEDYEYFWMLQQEVNTFAKMKNLNEQQKIWLTASQDLLKVPDAITSSLVSFSKDPSCLMAHRVKLAEAIVKGKELFKKKR